MSYQSFLIQTNVKWMLYLANGSREDTRHPQKLPCGRPRFNVVFCNPQIGTNVGSFGRTCIGLGGRLHLVKPLGFDIDGVVLGCGG